MRITNIRVDPECQLPVKDASASRTSLRSIQRDNELDEISVDRATEVVVGVSPWLLAFAILGVRQVTYTI